MPYFIKFNLWTCFFGSSQSSILRLVAVNAAVLLGLIFLSSKALAKENANLEVLDSLFKQNEYQKVIKNIRALPKDKLTLEHYRYLIFSLAEDDLDDAEEAAENMLKAMPNNPDAYLIHASIMGAQASDSVFSALGYAEKALKSLNKAVELAPNEIEYRQALMSFHLNAPGIAGGDTNIAMAQIRVIEQIDKVEGVVAMAWYQRTLGEPELSLELLQAAVEEFPMNVTVLNALASHHVAQENFSQAIDAYQKLTAIKLIRPSKDTKEVEEKYEDALFRQLNAHYQIGRVALQGKVRLEDGIKHMRMYIDRIKNTEAIEIIDTSNLPSVDWANLRLAGLLLANNQVDLAKTRFGMVVLDTKDENMQKVHKSLKRKLS
uniref:tetratricopeptide repeat protein n=1 Tax=Ningiella ruwaisensis TaxID=2364274 RepID=UPI0014469AF9|nr:hypothetical protein [Ningiella ruwaisensis]